MWFQVQQANHYLLPEGTHDELLQSLLRAPGIAEFWDKNKNAYDESFVDRVEQIRRNMKSLDINPDDIFVLIDCFARKLPHALQQGMSSKESSAIDDPQANTSAMLSRLLTMFPLRSH